MNLTYGAIALLLGILGILVGQLMVKKVGTRKMFTWVAIGLLAVGGVGFALPGTFPILGNTLSLGGSTLSVENGGASGSANSAGLCPYAPSASYVTKDKFGSTTISGTTYYDYAGAFAATTAPVIGKGIQYKYWIDNNTYYVQPQDYTGNCNGVNVQANAFQNTTNTITGYDLVNRQSTSAGAYNTSLGANGQANIEFTYQGTAKKSMIPFGGVFVVEYNSSISSVICNGANILTTNPYHVTYTVGATTRTYRMFAVDSSFDDGTGAVRVIDCQFQNGNSVVGAGAKYTATLIPANYYISNNGDIVLDIEKYANSDTTRTGLGQIAKDFFWS